MQEEVRRQLAPETPLQDFILENINNKQTRLKRTAMISQKTEPFIHSGITVFFPCTPPLE